MKISILILFSFFVIYYGIYSKPNEINKPEYQKILDSANVKGSILVFDPQLNNYYSNDFQWSRKGFLPASTFKIPNSIIALETGVAENDNTLFKWNGEKRRLPAWEKDLILKDAFRVSCVPCYQEIARKIGITRMKEFLKKFNYGKMDVNENNIDLFWLEGESRITQFQQIDFLHSFFFRKLPITSRTYEIMKRILLIEQNSEFSFSGKTGWSIRNGNNNGWFVGYIETAGKIYFVATNIVPKQDFDMDLFPIIRTNISLEAFKKLNLIR